MKKKNEILKNKATIKKFEILERVQTSSFYISAPKKNISINNVNKISKDNFFIFINNDNNCNTNLEKSITFNEKLSNLSNFESIIRSESIGKENNEKTSNFNSIQKNNKFNSINNNHETIETFYTNNLNMLENKIDGIKSLNNKKVGSDNRSSLKKIKTNINHNNLSNNFHNFKSNSKSKGNLSHNLSLSNRKIINTAKPLIKTSSISNNLKFFKDKPINLKKIRYDYSSKSKSPLRINNIKVNQQEFNEKVLKNDKSKKNETYENNFKKSIEKNPIFTSINSKDKSKLSSAMSEITKGNKENNLVNIKTNSNIHKNVTLTDLNLNDGISNIRNLKYKLHSNHNSQNNIKAKKNNFSCNMNILKAKESNEIIDVKNNDKSNLNNEISIFNKYEYLDSKLSKSSKSKKVNDNK